MILRPCNAGFDRFVLREILAKCSGLIVGLGLSGICFAQDDFFADITTESPTVVAEDSKATTKLYLQQRIKYGLQEPDSDFSFERTKSGFAQIRTDLYGEFQKKLTDHFTFKFSAKTEFEAYRWQGGEKNWESNNERFILRDALVDFTFGNDHWIRFGHQLFAWGEAESYTVTDILATRDLREFAQAEVQDLREQIFAFLYSFPLFGGKLNLVSTYDAGHHRYANRDDEFYPLIVFKDSPLAIRQRRPDSLFEFAAKFELSLNASDISFIAAEINDNDFAIGISNTDPAQVVLTQERVNVLGASGNRVIGSWLVKMELAGYFNQPVNSPAGYNKVDQYRGVFGLEYSGINEWFFSYELSLADTRKSSSAAVETGFLEPGHSVTVRYTSPSERFQQTLWYFDLLDNQGKIARWDLSYEWTDALTTGIGLVLYESKHANAQLTPFANHDTFNVLVTYYF